MSDKPRDFPVGNAFLELAQVLADKCSLRTDEFCIEAGQRLPQTVEALGTTLSILHRLASCLYGCQGGDHQVEWLTGKLVNQSVAAHRLIRAAQYDEALMLVRGIGEIVNLIWLFNEQRKELEAWQSADKKTRTRLFGPSAVRRRLKTPEMGAPIDDERYAALCDIGTHPTPRLAPGHYSGTGRPALGAIIQEVGVFVSVNELAYAISMSAPVASLLNATMEIRVELKQSCVDLLCVIGEFTVLNYGDGLREAFKRASQTK